MEKVFIFRLLCYWKYFKGDNLEYFLIGEFDESFLRFVILVYLIGIIIFLLRILINRLDMLVRYVENCFGFDLIGYLVRVLVIVKFFFLVLYGLKYVMICDLEMNESLWSNFIFYNFIIDFCNNKLV